MESDATSLKSPATAADRAEIVYPAPLKPGDTVAIVSPASIIDPALIPGAKRRIEAEGFNVKVYPHVLDSVGSYAGSAADRLADLADALTAPDVRAIICSRGGYGCVHLLDGLSQLDLKADPKWLVGFSDVSAIHALLSSRGIVSLHASMAKALSLDAQRPQPNAKLFSYLRGERPSLSFDHHQFNRPGTARGRLVGGNLAVVQALIATPFDIFAPSTILFIEDIAEPIYKIERILYQLRLAGILDRLAGLIIGQFTDYKPDKNFADVYSMINDLLGRTAFPIAFGAPVGHVDDNPPLLHGAMARLTVIPASPTLLQYL